MRREDNAQFSEPPDFVDMAASTSRARLDPDAAVGLTREDRAALDPLRRTMEFFAFCSFSRALGDELGFPEFTPAQLGARTRARCER
jgi:hypothetical protein